ncbi:hypothetical protein [Saccharopolyspora endophytica]|uniref:Uncharacterized protein n=1 Tax=Saccharopolyspora endophytica TaxID=543886 RepID=A0ABS5DKA3_9PSEU|nr:hypothetical protein [Saccharopolyspora endophytica]MBQ0926721.1 hypothetical protein [Saccharopolyspora endophytica]
MTWGETKRDRRLREAGKLMNAAAASLRARTGQAIAAGGETVPPPSRYAMASLLEALSHEAARGRVSEWTITEAVKLARSIVAEDRGE